MQNNRTDPPTQQPCYWPIDAADFLPIHKLLIDPAAREIRIMAWQKPLFFHDGISQSARFEAMTEYATMLEF